MGGLSWNTTDDSLKAAFSSYGEITYHRVATDRESGQSRGFGFVTFASAEQARGALAVMHDARIKGRQVRMSIAEDRRMYLPYRALKAAQEGCLEHEHSLVCDPLTNDLVT